MDQDRILTMAEVAERLRTPLQTLRWWRHCGRGPAGFKLGRRVVFRESEVEAWIQEQAKGQDGAA